jgi:hypothetical protein
MLSRLDNNIEHRILAQDAAKRSPSKATNGTNNAYGNEPDDVVT